MSWHYTDQWAAGFFDGEGCISITKRKRTENFIEHFLSVQIGQSTRECLEAIAEKFGGRVTEDCNKSRKHRFFRLRLHGGKAECFLKSIQPYSLVKRKEIDAALKLRSHIGTPGKRVSVKNQAGKEQAYQEWRKARGVALLERT